FPEIHIQIMAIKSWLRGIYHHCSKNHMQRYLDEYCFRFNRRQVAGKIFHKLVQRMICHPPFKLIECDVNA
ncbi:MAG: transposase, partial [Cytophagaceae bacterium]